MTRAHENWGQVMTAQARTGDNDRTFTVRELVAYNRLIINRERVDPERVVHDFIRSNPNVDLEARSTITAWADGLRPTAGAGSTTDTAERPNGFGL